MRTLLLMLVLAIPLLAAEPSPREQVLNLVPPETSVCFVIQNLRDRATAVANSPFAAWASTKVLPGLEGNPDVDKLKMVDSVMNKMLGVSLQDLRDDILGDCIALAYLPAEKNRTERGVVILHARNPQKLESLINKVNQIQKSSGELTGLTHLKHHGVDYVRRDRENSKEFYVLNDHLFAISLQEEAIQSVINLKATPSESAVLKDLNSLKMQDAFLACWLAPRSLDAELAAKAGETESEKAGRAQVAKIWNAVDQCAIYLRANESLELGVSVTYRAGALPPEWKTVFGKAPSESPLWSSVPSNSILAAVVDLEATAILDVVSSFLPEADRTRFKRQIERELGVIIGKNNVMPLVSNLGPKIGLWIGPSKAAMPHVTAMVELRGNQAEAKKVIDFYTQLLQYDYNRDHEDAIEKTVTGDLAVFTNDKLFPRGVSPAYQVSNGYAVFASSPEAISTFKATGGLPIKSNDVPLIRVSAKLLREHLLAQQAELTTWIAQLQGREAEEIRKELETVSRILDAMDTAELVTRGDDKSRTIALKLKLIKPLK